MFTVKKSLWKSEGRARPGKGGSSDQGVCLTKSLPGRWRPREELLLVKGLAWWQWAGRCAAVLLLVSLGDIQESDLDLKAQVDLTHG